MHKNIIEAQAWLDRVRLLPNNKTSKENLDHIKKHADLLQWLIDRAMEATSKDV